MKKLAALLCGAALAVSSICSATVSPDKIGIGRAVPGMTVDQLISIYGQPVSRHGDNLIFRDFKVEVDDDRPGIVDSIETNSGAVATPAGVSVGQGAEVLNNSYGSADKIDEDWNKTEYEYFSSDYSRKIEFVVKRGVIVEIKCKVRD